MRHRTPGAFARLTSRLVGEHTRFPSFEGFLLHAETSHTMPNSTMRRFQRAAAILVLVGLTAPALADVAGDERDLKQLTADIQAAVVSENLAFLEATLHPDYVHTRPNGIVTDRAGFLASVKRDKAEPNVNYDKLTSTDVAVRVYGDTAVLTGRSGIASKDASGRLDGETRWTRVFVRQDGRWKIVAFQATLVP